MKINAGFAVYVDVIEFEPFMGENIDDYKKAFEEWYFEEIEYGGMLVLEKKANLKIDGLNGNAIVTWMNEVAPGCNAKIIKYHIPPEQEDTSLPGMYF